MASSSSNLFLLINRRLKPKKRDENAFFYTEVNGIKYLCYIPKEAITADPNMIFVITENAPPLDKKNPVYAIDFPGSLDMFANSKFEFYGKSEETFTKNTVLLATLKDKNNAFFTHFFPKFALTRRQQLAKPFQLPGPSIPLPSIPSSSTQSEEFNWDTVKNELLRKLPSLTIDDVIVQTSSNKGTFSGFVNTLFKLEAGRKLTWTFDDVIKKLSNEKSHIIEDNEKKLIQILYVIHVNTTA